MTQELPCRQGFRPLSGGTRCGLAVGDDLGGRGGGAGDDGGKGDNRDDKRDAVEAKCGSRPDEGHPEPGDFFPFQKT